MKKMIVMLRSSEVAIRDADISVVVSLSQKTSQMLDKLHQRQDHAIIAIERVRGEPHEEASSPEKYICTTIG